MFNVHRNWSEMPGKIFSLKEKRNAREEAFGKRKEKA